MTEFQPIAGAQNASINAGALQHFAEHYLQDCELRLHSPESIRTRRALIHSLTWFLHHRGYETCGVMELRQFFYYLMHGHEEPGGRFGQVRLNKAARPTTIRDYYICLRSMFKWLALKGVIPETPFASIPKPLTHEQVKPPLSPQHVEALLRAAQDSPSPVRDAAVVLFLLDTGCRAGEVIALTFNDVDLKDRSCEVFGKRGKSRTVYFGEQTAQALERYLRASKRIRSDGMNRELDSPLFLPLRGRSQLTVSGLRCVIRRLSMAAGIKASCSPHAFRRTFAVQTLRNGANVFGVQAMLGHSDLEMTRRYCLIAEADVESQHRRFAPVDRLDLAGATAFA